MVLLLVHLIFGSCCVSLKDSLWGVVVACGSSPTMDVRDDSMLSSDSLSIASLYYLCQSRSHNSAIISRMFQLSVRVGYVV